MAGEFEKKIEKIHSGINALAQIRYIDENKKIEFINQTFNKEKIIVHLSSDFKKWMHENFVEAHTLDFDICKKAINAYFYGKPPLVERRERESIPDAFIFQELTQIKNKSPHTYFISQDKRFLHACKTNIINLETFATLDEFIISDTCKSFTEINGTEKASLIEYMSTNQAILASELSDKTIDFLVGKTIHSSKIPDDNNEATINSTYDPSEVSFDIQEAVYYGGGIIVVPCSFKIDVCINYYVYKPDYYAMEKTLSVSDHDDHYYAVEKTVKTIVYGYARFEFDVSELENIGLVNCGIDSVDDIDVL